MNTQYIKSLVDLYFACASTVEQERELKEYFSGKNIDYSLEMYRDLFAPEYEEPSLGENFDSKILSKIAPTRSATRVLVLQWASMAACVALLVGLGIVNAKDSTPYIPSYQQDTFTDPHQALKQVEITLAFIAQKVGQSEQTMRKGVEATQPIFELFGSSIQEDNKNIKNQ